MCLPIKNFLISKRLHNWIIGLTLLDGIIFGAETFITKKEFPYTLLNTLNDFILFIFFIEILGKIFVIGIKDFFKSGWHKFDFIIISISLLNYFSSLEFIQFLIILRVMIILEYVPRMRIIWLAIEHALASVVNIILFGTFFLYVWALVAVHLFKNIAPNFFGDVGIAMGTLARALILVSIEKGIQDEITSKNPYAWIFFLSFLVMMSMIILNLLVGTIVRSVSAVYDQSQEK